MITILNPPVTERNPSVVRRTSAIGEAYNSEVVRIDGDFARVSITTGEDWQLIRMMRHGIDFFAPEKGDGLMVKANLLAR